MPFKYEAPELANVLRAIHTFASTEVGKSEKGKALLHQMTEILEYMGITPNMHGGAPLEQFQSKTPAGRLFLMQWYAGMFITAMQSEGISLLNVWLNSAYIFVDNELVE